MGTFAPDVRVESYRSMELQRGNRARFTYQLSRGKKFPEGTTGYLTIFNTYGQTLGIWPGIVSGGKISFDQSEDIADAIPRGANWTLITEFGDKKTMRVQGTVIRNEAPWPDQPALSGEFDGAVYRYSFGTPGFVVDPAWRIMNGRPRVYDNSLRGLPNAVAAGSITGGNPTLFDDVAMLYYAPLRTDAIRLTYNTIRFGAGMSWIAICSNYDMTNYAAILHRGVYFNGTFQSDNLCIVTGSGPVTTVQRTTPITHTTGQNQNYTAEYNPLTNTYAVYVGSSLTPLAEWEDTFNIVQHGEGERYFGMGFRSDLLTPGVEVSDIIIGDTP